MLKKSLADRFRWYWRISNRIEAFELRRFGTSAFRIAGRLPVLLLETTGRRTGKLRRTPVVFWHLDGALYFGGGAAGMTKVDWVANVRANPDVYIWIDRKRTPVRVIELHGVDRESAKAEILRRRPSVERYELRSGRRTPFFRADPRPE